MHIRDPQKNQVKSIPPLLYRSGAGAKLHYNHNVSDRSVQVRGNYHPVEAPIVEPETRVAKGIRYVGL
jgi:hypothetical protein